MGLGALQCCAQGDSRRLSRAPGEVAWNQETMVSCKPVNKVLEAAWLSSLGFMLLAHEGK